MLAEPSAGGVAGASFSGGIAGGTTGASGAGSLGIPLSVGAGPATGLTLGSAGAALAIGSLATGSGAGGVILSVEDAVLSVAGALDTKSLTCALTVLCS